MIVQFLIQFVVLIIGFIMSWAPTVTTLPSIGGYDIDTQLSTGMSMFYTYAQAVWPLLDVFAGFLFLMSFYILKMVFKLFMGHRAPGTLH